jgi:MoaA/NifB/PqqE/SkfB family radical SAM enzyme
MTARRLVLVWRVTERCDTRCPFCAFDAGLRRPRRELDAAEALRFGDLVARWAEDRGRGVLVSWLGGEPLLWPELETTSATLRSRGLQIGLTTNGRGLGDPDRRRWALDSLDELTLSIDGPPSVHDRIRGRPGSGRELLATLRALRGGRGDRPRPLLRVNTVLMRGNVDRFPELVGLVADAGADELTFNALGGRDRPEFFPANRLRPADVESFAASLPDLRLDAGRRGLQVRGAGSYLARLRASAAGVPLPVEDCGPGRDFWFVEVDGRLAPCSFTAAEYGIPIAELERPSDLDALPARLATARLRRRAGPCLDCPSTHVHAKFAEASA